MVFFFFFFIYFFSFFSFLSYIIYDIIITFRGRLRRVRTSRPYYVAIPRPQRFYRYKTMSSNIIQCQTRLTRSFSTRNRLFPPTFLRVPKKFPVEQCEKNTKIQRVLLDGAIASEQISTRRRRLGSVRKSIAPRHFGVCYVCNRYERGVIRVLRRRETRIYRTVCTSTDKL